MKISTIWEIVCRDSAAKRVCGDQTLIRPDGWQKLQESGPAQPIIVHIFLLNDASDSHVAQFVETANRLAFSSQISVFYQIMPVDVQMAVKFNASGRSDVAGVFPSSDEDQPSKLVISPDVTLAAIFKPIDPEMLYNNGTIISIPDLSGKVMMVVTGESQWKLITLKMQFKNGRQINLSPMEPRNRRSFATISTHKRSTASY